MYKNKKHRFRVEWFYTGALAFLTACLIMLILFTSFIISNAEGNSIISEDDLIVVSDIETWFSEHDLDFSDYSSCVNGGYTSSLDNSVYVGSYSDIISYLSGRSLSCSYNIYDYAEQSIDYNIIEDVVFSSSDLQSAPYVVQVSSGGTYMYKFFFKPRYDGSGNFSGFDNLDGLKIFRNYIFVPENVCVLDVYMSDNDSVSTAGLHSCSVGVSGYYSYLYNDDDDVYQVLTYDRLPGSYNTVATNIDTVALKTNDIENDYDLSNNADLFSDSDMTSTMKTFYTTIGLDVDGLYKIYIKPLGKEDDSTYPDGSGGDDTNNMYMRTADWQFNIPKYWGNVSSTLVKPEYTSAWGSGNVVFYGLINDYQRDHSDHFKLVFNFYILCQGHIFSDTHSEVDRNFSGSFALRSVEVPLQDFIDNNNTVTFSVHDLFNECLSNSNENVLSFIEPLKSVNSINKWKWTLSCDAQLQAGNYVSGNIQETYNFISQVSKEDSNTITENHNPYQPDPDNPDIDDEPDEDDDYSGKGIHLHNVNNDNDSLVINNGSDPAVVQDLYNEMTTPIGNGGFTDKFLEITQSNQWFQVMSTALPWVGSEFWSTMNITWTVILAIIGCSFCLWIIVHIL